jgi:sulfhydrogenase subunit beta (sulfur reductase)
MPEIHLEVGATVALPKEELGDLLDVLHQAGYKIIGPKVADHTIVYQEIQDVSDLPLGYVTEQEAASYRLIETGNGSYFGYTPGAHSWKQFFFPPRTSLFHLESTNDNWNVEFGPREDASLALFGVRPCELFAIQIQDRVFLRNDWQDPYYRIRRESAFILVADCLQPGATCFCTSMGCGPGVEEGFDLRLTELEDVFIVKIGSEAGRMILSDLKWKPASAFWITNAQRELEQSRQRIQRQIPNVAELPAFLLDNLEAAHWDDVGKRCMSCANCTLVCPTCFCWDAQDVNDLSGKAITRERVWDSCFNPEYSHVFGGNLRPNTRSRYRQWLTHKLGSWKQQFGVLGCVGCGRCITWCPAGIDITAEVAALRQEVLE